MESPSSNDSSPPGWLEQPLLPPLCARTLAAAALMNAMDVGDSSHAGGETVGLSGQVAVKLVVAAAAAALGLWGLAHSRALRTTITTLPVLLLCLLGGTFVVTSVVALPETARVSRVAPLVFLGYVAFVPTALAVLGLRRVIVSILSGLVAFLIGSWLLYLLVPSLGVFVEVGDGYEVARMGGLGHPNALARAAMLVVLLAMVLLRQSERRRGLLVVLMLLGLVTAAAAISRTAIIAGGFAIALLLLDWLPPRRALVGILAVLVLLMTALLAVQLAHPGDPVAQTLLPIATKTGDVDELLSATGRTEIWQVAWGLIEQRPLFGYGLGSAPALLHEHSQHTHNVVLHPLLSGGVVAGGLVITLLLWNLVLAAQSAEPVVRGLVAFILVSGMFEDTLLDPFPGPPTLLWILATVYPAAVVVSARMAGHTPSRQAAAGAEGDRDVEGLDPDGYTTVAS